MLIMMLSRSLGNTEMGVPTYSWNGEEWEAEIRECFPKEVIF